MKDPVEVLLAEFGEAIGSRGLAFDENGICYLATSEDMLIVMRRDDRRGRLIMVGVIAHALPASLDRSCIEALLELGLRPLSGDGIGAGLDRATGAMLLYRAVQLGESNGPGLREQALEFAAAQRLWRGRLASPRRVET